MKEIKKAVQKPLKAPTTITDGQNEITLLIQKAYLEKWSKEQIEKNLYEIIQSVVTGLPLNSLAADAQRSLYNHANRVMATLQSKLNLNIIQKAIKENIGFDFAKLRNKFDKKEVQPQSVGYAETVSGMPLNYWNASEYIKKRVLPVMNELSEMNALDPNDFSGKNSLRNLAEMEIRYHNHELEKIKLKESGNKLVVSSEHADCSKRCYEWQGRVYSLDGTSGKTDDGRDYVPLETATDVFYTTKAGKTYKNGLLGFNCRHKLRPYISEVMPEKITEEEQKKQYAINLEQRNREQSVRRLKLKAALYQGVDSDEYKDAKEKAMKAAQEYKAFCKKNERAFYSERLQVLKPSTEEERDKYRKIELEKIRYIDKLREMDYNKHGRLPNAIAARTPKEKFVEYALNKNNASGKDKAFLIEKVLGYNEFNWIDLANKVYDASQTAQVVKRTKNSFGESYTVKIKVNGLKGKDMNLVAGWFFDNGSLMPRLVTLYPGKKEK